VSDVREFFEPGGVLSRFHPTYEPRGGQQRMAAAVAETLLEGGRLLVEAGTGTGKTLAYLAPAILSGRGVVVSTATRNLQDQVFRNELPFLRERVGLRFTACLLKGRDNYLCRYRLARFEREPLLEEPGERDWVGRLAAWSRSTTTGDRAEIPDLPDGLRLWRDVNARADTCTGPRCPEYDACWLTRARRRAQDSQIVVVNHHLLLADRAGRSAFGAVVPAHDAVVLDEAHRIEDIATQYFGTQASSAQIEELARAAETLSGRGGRIVRGAGGAAELRWAADALLDPIRALCGREVGRVRLDPTERGGPDLAEAWAGLGEALEGIVREMPRSDPAAAESLEHRVDDLRGRLERVLERSDPACVYGAEPRGRGGVVLTASPIDVAEPLRRDVFDALHAAVLTSATLTVRGSFAFFAERLGLADATTLAVGSPFDHAAQAVLYLPSEVPEPQHPGFLDRGVREIEALLDVTLGRAFLLFTSVANLGRVHEALARRGRWRLFVQGDGTKASLVDAFRSTERAVLLGTASFWHGVDVPGDALSLVVIDRLPFDVPSDPLIAARIERIRAQGGNPFDEYQLPLAVLELKQGLGRLLRSASDRGVLSVLDPRLGSRRYGRVFLESLPPYHVVHDLDACARFFHGEGAAADRGVSSSASD